MGIFKLITAIITLSATVACASSSEKKNEAKPNTSAAVSKLTVSADGDAIVDAVAAGKMEQVKKLIANGQSVDALSSNDQTALMKVAEDGDQTTVDQLLKLGASLNKANSKGETAVWSAVAGGHEALALKLIDKGAKVDFVDESKECLMHYAAKMQLPKVASRLKKLTPKCLTQKNIDGQTPADIAMAIGDKKVARILAPGKIK